MLKKRCEWIVGNNRRILICDEHWEKIFKDIEDNEELLYMCKAFMINDELYNYGKMLAEDIDVEE